MQGASEENPSELHNGEPRAGKPESVMDLRWIEEGLTKPGKNKSGLAKALGRSPSMVTALLKGERRLSADEVPIVAKYLEVTAPMSVPLRQRVQRVESVSIIGEVAGGVWAEPGLAFEPIPTTVARDARWPAGAVYLLRVRGNSINRKAKDGDLVLCLDAHAAPRAYQSGDWVIAERKRGGLVETTVKRVELAQDGSWFLAPDSDDRNFQDPIKIDETAVDEVRVIAFVMQFLTPATEF